MPEPFSTGVSAAKTGFELALKAKGWMQPRDTTERLLFLVGTKLSDRTALGYSELLVWLDDVEFARELDRLVSPPHEAHSQALAAAIAPLVGPPDLETTAEEFADEVAELWLSGHDRG